MSGALSATCCTGPWKPQCQEQQRSPLTWGRLNFRFKRYSRLRSRCGNAFPGTQVDSVRLKMSVELSFWLIFLRRLAGRLWLTQANMRKQEAWLTHPSEGLHINFILCCRPRTNEIPADWMMLCATPLLLAAHTGGPHRKKGVFAPVFEVAKAPYLLER